MDAMQKFINAARVGDVSRCKEICEGETRFDHGNALYAATLYSLPELMKFVISRDENALSAALMMAFQTKHTSSKPFEDLLSLLPGGREAVARSRNFGGR
jgi:hypothetical protein